MSFDQLEYRRLLAEQARQREHSQTRGIDALARDLQPQRHPLAQALADATRAQGFAPRDAGNPATSMAPATVLVMRLDDAMPAPTAGQAYDRSADLGPAGHTSSLRGQIATGSRVYRAGAQIITVADNTPTHVSGDWLANTTDQGTFTVVRPARTVSTDEIEDGDEPAPLTVTNILRTAIDLPEQASHSMHFKVTRADWRMRSADVIAYELGRSIAGGIAGLVDRLLLQKLATTPGLVPFNLARAAAQGVVFGELAAFAGTSATGAATGADGVLRVAGIGAELTDAVPGSLVAALRRTGVAIDSQIRVVSKRTGLQGELDIVIYVNAQALVPDAGAVWSAA